MKIRTATTVGGSVLVAALAMAGALVKHWEGTRYQAYQDSGGVWTICEGHTRGVKRGDEATPEQCESYRQQDLTEAADAVERCIHVPLTSNQLGALISATYNLGPGVVCGSTLQRKANAGDIRGACAELTEALNSDGGRRGWSFTNGVFVRGLYLRRTDERGLCWPDFSNVIGGVS